MPDLLANSPVFSVYSAETHDAHFVITTTSTQQLFSATNFGFFRTNLSPCSKTYWERSTMPDKPVPCLAAGRMGSGQKCPCPDAARHGRGWKPRAGGINNSYKGKRKAAVSQKGIRALCTQLLVNTPVGWTSLPHGDAGPWWEPITHPGWPRKGQRLGQPLTCSEPKDLGPQAALCSPGPATPAASPC